MNNYTPNSVKSSSPSRLIDHTDTLADLDRDEFARRLTLSVLGHRHAWALDQADFIDRRPDAPRILANGKSA